MLKPYILDGAMGSEIIKRGFSLPKHIWSAFANINNPNLVYKIHNEYINSGANFIIANTFRTTPRSYKKTGINLISANKLAYQSLNSAIDIANLAAKKNTKIFASVAPLEDCYKPKLFPGYKIAKKEFQQLEHWLKNTKINGVLLETMNNAIEIKAALTAFQNLQKPVWVSLFLKTSQHIASGDKIIDIISIINNFNVDCLLLNCNSLSLTEKALKILNSNWDGKIGIYPNLGPSPPIPDGNIDSICSDENYILHLNNLLNYELYVIGGCCGSSPNHTKLLKNFIDNNC